MTTRLQIEMTVLQDWRIGARRVLTLEGESLEELGALAVDIAPGLAALARKLIAERAAQEGAADDPAE